MVARRAGLDAPRSGQVAGEHAAKGRLGGLGAEQAAPVRRLKGEHLALFRQRPLDLVDRGPRACGQYQLACRVLANAREKRQVERMRGLQRPAEPPLRAAGDNLDRLLRRQRRRDRLAQFFEASGGEAGHTPKLSL